MARMPRGEPRSVPDPAGDQYDAEMAQARAQREAEDRGFESPLDMAQDALEDFQNGPKIARPNAVASFIPVVGPAWEAAADLQDGNYGGAVFNVAMAAGDLLPVGAVVKGARAARKGIGLLKSGSVSADAARKAIRRVELAGKGEEIHHTIPLKGLSRNAQDWRNHYPLLKVLPKATHRRLTGKWDGMPRFDPLRQIWHGTTDWQKTVPTAIVSSAADAVENVTRPFQPPPKTTAPQPKPKPKK
ncbi:hypothetical protein [Phenylobacterium conjunctum]|uniref:Uncharacterized protein n=1 Tax=Phenylobacterium conjunctum TaxID=1298959 RepID=A0ABW3T300_9CAUL